MELLLLLLLLLLVSAFVIVSHAQLEMAVKTSIAWVVIVVVLVVFVLTGSTFVALSSLIVVGERSILFPFTSQTFLHLPFTPRIAAVQHPLPRYGLGADEERSESQGAEAPASRLNFV